MGYVELKNNCRYTYYYIFTLHKIFLGDESLSSNYYILYFTSLFISCNVISNQMYNVIINPRRTRWRFVYKRFVQSIRRS